MSWGCASQLTFNKANRQTLDALVSGGASFNRPVTPGVVTPPSLP
jgi:hypothetical protein